MRGAWDERGDLSAEVGAHSPAALQLMKCKKCFFPFYQPENVPNMRVWTSSCDFFFKKRGSKANALQMNNSWWFRATLDSLCKKKKIQKKRLNGTHSLRQQKAHLPLYSTPNMSSNRYPLRTEFIMGGDNPIRYFNGDPTKNSCHSQSRFSAAAQMCLLMLPHTHTHARICRLCMETGARSALSTNV